MGTREDRQQIAVLLNKIPTACPADMHEWVLTGHQLIEDDRGDIVFSPDPDTASGAFCALAAAVHEPGRCYCGKFRTAGRELTDGRA
ncbi:hypothetical protein OG874_00090 [Nocardia sp. NBC_00565]|uniref:hypothetical protein n=1 Tax=Nocardia sp. NBC_00565 TaxID=2975993 RepID=UPI002E80FD4D|nr:hypothetical protein [Nocardia sp. NBC_00565]WUC03653.1 hypothetical protein OG874_00090 [Nocardia sp. NBC_00565]